MAYTTINKPSEHFNTVTWTGNGSKITTGLRPDLIWYKARNVSGYGGVVNAIRGDDYYLQTYTTDAETYSSGLLVSDSTGFTPSSIFTTNSYVAWNWLANGAGVSNTDGSIASTVSANTTSGFSIVQYTGDGSGASATIGHGLGVTPACVIMKPLNYGGAWWIAHKTMPTNYLLEFNNNPQANILTSFGGGGLSLVRLLIMLLVELLTLMLIYGINQVNLILHIVSQKKKASQNLVAILVMVMLMEHLFILE